MDKKRKLLIGLFAGVMVLLVIGVTSAYFLVARNTSGNTGIVDVTTTELANLTMTSMKSQTGSPVYPGWVGWQGIDVSATGSGKVIYDLVLNISGDSQVINDVQIDVCKIEDTQVALAANQVTYTAASAQVNTGVSPVRYYMTGGSVTLPSGCTSVLSGVTLGSLGTSKLISTQGGKELVGGKRDKYYVKITYVNNTSGSQTQGQTFTITPSISTKTEKTRLTAVNTLKDKANPISNVDYTTSTAAQKAEMYTFNHPATVQTPALTDYRYIGNNPNNYVYYNCTDTTDTSTCEIWRILGVFSVENVSGQYEERIKLVRNEPIYTATSWATYDGINDYENEWVGGNLVTLLNSGDYYNRVNDCSDNGLTSSAKSIISNAKWYLGAPTRTYDEDTGNYIITSAELYSQERSNQVVQDSNHNTYTTLYSLGIMYPSDYSYSYANGVDESCFTNPIQCYDEYNYPYEDNFLSWLRNPGFTEWFISPDYDSIYGAWIVTDYGHFDVYGDVLSDHAMRPVLYLSADVEFDTTDSTADGSQAHPYVLKYS